MVGKFLHLCCKKKKRAKMWSSKKGTEKIINLNRGDGRVCPRNGSDAPGLIPEPIQDKVCGES